MIKLRFLGERESFPVWDEEHIEKVTQALNKSMFRF